MRRPTLSDADEGAASSASGTRIGQYSGKSAIDAEGMDESSASMLKDELPSGSRAKPEGWAGKCPAEKDTTAVIQGVSPADHPQKNVQRGSTAYTFTGHRAVALGHLEFSDLPKIDCVILRNRFHLSC